jgi:hypothetical protein
MLYMESSRKDNPAVETPTRMAIRASQTREIIYFQLPWFRLQQQLRDLKVNVGRTHEFLEAFCTQTRRCCTGGSLQ